MKNLIIVLVVIAGFACVWYLFVKPYEYEVNMEAKTLPGDIIETIRIWNKSLDSGEIIKIDSLKGLSQKLKYNGSTYLYNWHFEKISDTTTLINIAVSQPDRSFKNKVLVPFTDQPIEKDASDLAHNFHDILKEHLEITAVKIEGESQMKSSFCVCSTLNTKQINKALGMMRDYGLLTSFVADFKLQVDGPPIVKINKWSHNKGMLSYDFCFPIIKTDSLPKVSTFTYKEINKEKALKAIYHGNYITSDRAWYALLNYAATNGYEVNGLPIEHFHNNPNLGVNEIEWKAEIYLPIK